MIKCFSNVNGHKNAQEIVIDLNQIMNELYFWYAIQSIAIGITIYATFQKYEKKK